MSNILNPPEFKLNDFLVDKRNKTIVEVIGLESGFYTLRRCSDKKVQRFWCASVDAYYIKLKNLKLARRLYA